MLRLRIILISVVRAGRNSRIISGHRLSRNYCVAITRQSNEHAEELARSETVQREIRRGAGRPAGSDQQNRSKTVFPRIPGARSQNRYLYKERNGFRSQIPIRPSWRNSTTAGIFVIKQLSDSPGPYIVEIADSRCMTHAWP